jgi:hypothetical protein
MSVQRCSHGWAGLEYGQAAVATPFLMPPDVFKSRNLCGGHRLPGATSPLPDSTTWVWSGRAHTWSVPHTTTSELAY